MNRRDFFRRTLPAVTVTIAASQCGWSLGKFKALLSRILGQCQSTWSAKREVVLRQQLIMRQTQYQAKMAMEAVFRKVVNQQLYGRQGSPEVFA